MSARGLLVVAALWAAALAVLAGQGAPSPALLRNHPAIAYHRTAPDDPIARLNARLERGEVYLETDGGPAGYLLSVLDALDVPVESQVLVFSKTSFQAPRIGPSNPRAIYFNDRVSVGWVRGGEVLEFIGQDPRQGGIFYTLSQQPDGRPHRFERNDACVSCHTSEATRNVPGPFIGSVFPGPDGTTQYGPAYTTDHRSPFEVRWGGWYVTGSHRADRHMGNAIAHDPSNLAGMITRDTVHVTRLDGRFEMTGYPSPHSDLVALMILEHQAHLTNLMTRIGWEARVRPEARGPLADLAAELVDYLLFVNEAPLPGPVAGTSAFARHFAAAGPRDSRGRSLRDLDLTSRLMRYPCSYLIYSEMFDALADEAKDAIYARMWAVLSGQDAAPRYSVLSAEDRRNVIDILRETKPGLPEYFW